MEGGDTGEVGGGVRLPVAGHDSLRRMNEEMLPERLAVAVFELEDFVVPPGERVLVSGQYEAARGALSAVQLAVIEGIYAWDARGGDCGGTGGVCVPGAAVEGAGAACVEAGVEWGVSGEEGGVFWGASLNKQ